MALLFGINLIPIFVVNNVDYSAHLGICISIKVEPLLVDCWGCSII